MFWHVSHPDLLERRVLDHTIPLCCKINLKSPAHILEHHLWISLVNKSILAFIPYYGWILCRSWWSKWLVSDRQHGNRNFKGSCWRSLTIISRRQLDQKIMRVYISYTHLYPINPLNHTLPFRKCKLCFWANMQVASTLWPDIKSQKISQRWFRLIGPSVAQEPLQIHSRQAETSMDQTREARTAHKMKIGGGWRHGLVGRPGPWAPPP